MFTTKKKRREFLRRVWGKPVDKFRDLDLIASYHNLLSPAEDNSIVDEKTWNDLDLDSFFSKIDRNISGIGQQYLYHILHKFEKDENFLKRRFELFSYWKRDQACREKIQFKLFGLSGQASYFVSSLLLNKSLPDNKYYRLFYLCPVVSVISVILISFNPVFLFAGLAVLLINLVLHNIFSKRIYEYFIGFSSLNSLITAAVSIGKIKPEIPVAEIEFLKQKSSMLTSLNKKLGYLVIDKESLNGLALIVIEYLNMFLLFDVIAYYRSVSVLLKYQNEIHEVFKSVAGLDASISVASYLEELPVFSNPVFNNSGLMNFRNLYHPLIRDAVPNSLENISKSMMITGSNMSGKTTFIKTVGINFILSQTFYFSLSEETNIPALIVKSAIRRNEDLGEGKSYFFAEIEALNNFIKLSEEKEKYLFLIDEIFRGTNTVEKLASSVAVLRYLNMRSRVFVTTHDIELQDLLGSNFIMYHFSEQVEDGKFFFNYKIKEGPCTSGNAIKLLEIMKYPDSIITEAKTVVKKLIK